MHTALLTLKKCWSIAVDFGQRHKYFRVRYFLHEEGNGGIDYFESPLFCQETKFTSEPFYQPPHLTHDGRLIDQ